MSWSTQPNTQIFTYFRAEKQLKEFTGERNAEKNARLHHKLTSIIWGTAL